MGTYDRQIAAVKRAIERKGALVTWRQVRQGAPADPLKPWLPGDVTNTDKNVRILFLQYSKDAPNETKALLTMAGNTDLIEGKLYGLMAVQTFEPSLADIVMRENEQLNVNVIDTWKPNNQKIFHIIGFNV